MIDAVHAEATSLADNDSVRQILDEVCRLTDMGFAAVARVTEERWIACQVLDKIEFGLDAGGELKVSTTICDDIRKTCRAVVIDDVAAEEDWRTHPTPVLYGFQSYLSVPILLSDGTFFGTLCAIDPRPRTLRARQIMPEIQRLAGEVANLIEASVRRISQKRA